ncbi:hypothetical protein J2T56_003123 [Natronobacillus azotifigens]
MQFTMKLPGLESVMITKMEELVTRKYELKASKL